MTSPKPTDSEQLDEILIAHRKTVIDAWEHRTKGSGTAMQMSIDADATAKTSLLERDQQIELKILQRVERMGEAEASKQGYGAHNIDGYHRAYGEIVSHTTCTTELRP